MLNQTLQLSPTVTRVQQSLADEKSVYATDIVKLILKLHPEYANSSTSISLAPNKISVKKHVDNWLYDVYELFDPDLVQELHGRLVIIGLSRLDDDLKQQLDAFRFLEALYSELRESLDDLLRPAIQVREAESVVTHADNPLQQIGEDQLGRAVYARYLAKRLTAISKENTSLEILKNEVDNNSQLAYAVHLYGPWGSGKSTLLNFLKDELKQDWLVVEFNAWRNQHITPPWWALMESVFQQSKKSLSPWGLVSEYWWRLRLGKAHYFLYIFLSSLIFGIGFFIYGKSIFGGLDEWMSVAKNISVALTTLVGTWAAIQGVSRSLLFGSKKTAEGYLATSSNPMEKISNRFSKLIERIESNKKSKRVMIIIDDLDRCQGRYVVDLLEGFQTLFRKKSVFFIVAADQRWLNACFEEVYSKLRPHVQEPGKHLGMLFLEKVFQFSAPVPGIPLPLREAYLHHLLKMKEPDSEEDVQSAYIKAKAEIDKTQKDAELSDVIKESATLSFIEQRAMREEAIIRFASPNLTKDIETHTLAPFIKLIEPNPRSMKRLVNAYSINRVLSILGHLNINKEQIVLWTILTMRWPELANHLEKVPEDLERMGKERNAGDNSSISTLLEDKDKKIRDVVSGTGLPASLDEETIKSCAMLKT